ncbi:MAG: phenylacetate--CoA ligase family protein, partial [Candidatus Kapaibacterium sp.]
SLHEAIKIFALSRKAPFYSDKYSEVQLPGNHEDWLRLPLLTKQEVLRRSYPESLDMLTMPLENMIVVATGGSTGVARHIVLTHEEWDLFADMQAEALKLMGITTQDKVANLFVAGHMWPSFLGGHEIIKKIGAIHLPISANMPPQEAYEICMQFQPNVMLSLPTLFDFMAMEAKKSGKKFDNLKLVAYAGEQMSRAARTQIAKHLGCEKIRALAYTSSDAGLMGYQCEHCESYEYHVPTGFQFIEIIDSETGRPAEPGQSGEMVITNLGRISLPIVRYLIGDMGHFAEGQCKCGDPNPVFALEGRTGDDFKLGGGFISMEAIDDAVGNYADDLSMNYQVVLEDIEDQMDIYIRIECADESCDPAIAKNLRSDLLGAVPEFAKGLELNYIRNFEVETLKPGSLERSPRTGKIRKLVDKRHD